MSSSVPKINNQSFPILRSPSFEEPPSAADKPLDAFTQELIRENELLIADVDQLRDNEDRLIGQITALQTQLTARDGKLAKEVAALTEQLAAKDEAIAALASEKDAELSALREKLATVQHTLEMIEESSQAHHEQMEAMEAELEESRAEVARLREALSEAHAHASAVSEVEAKSAAMAEASAKKAVATALLDMNANLKFVHATIKSIFKSIKGTLVFSVYGDPIGKPFEDQPCPSLSITDTEAAAREADMALIHKRICETVRRVEGFATMGDAAAGAVGVGAEDHPLRAFVSTSLEACTLLVSLYTSLGKIGLHSARQKYKFSGGGAGGEPLPIASISGNANSSASSSSASASTSAEAKPASRGLGLWAR